MEKLSLTCKVLYDKDICDKANELRKYKTPKILFSDVNAWNKLVKKADKYLSNEINNIDNEVWSAAHFIEHFKPLGFYDKMFSIIKTYLLILTNNQVWAEEKASNIMRGMLAMFDALYSTLEMGENSNMFSINDIIWKYINKILVIRLDDYARGHGIIYSVGELTKIPYHKCIICKQIKESYGYFIQYRTAICKNSLPHCDNCYDNVHLLIKTYNDNRWSRLVIKMKNKFI